MLSAANHLFQHLVDAIHADIRASVLLNQSTFRQLPECICCIRRTLQHLRA